MWDKFSIFYPSNKEDLFSWHNAPLAFVEAIGAMLAAIFAAIAALREVFGCKNDESFFRMIKFIGL